MLGCIFYTPKPKMIIRKDQEMISQKQMRSRTTKGRDNMSYKPLMMIRRSMNRMIFSILFNVYRIINFLIYILKLILIVIMSSGTISWVKLQIY